MTRAAGRYNAKNKTDCKVCTSGMQFFAERVFTDSSHLPELVSEDLTPICDRLCLPLPSLAVNCHSHFLLPAPPQKLVSDFSFSLQGILQEILREFYGTFWARKIKA